jgi:3-hydroxyacyl-[acyl-carrier-protein] dehydratase
MRWRMVDRIEEIVPGERAAGWKGVTLAEDYFEDHFPKFPVVPGVILIEALAQLSGKLIELSVWEERGMWPFPVLSMVRNAKFRRFIRPGESIRLETKLVEIRDESAITKCRALVDGKVTTDAELLFVFDPDALDDALGQDDLIAIEHYWLKILWPGWGEYLKTSRRRPGKKT